MTTAQVQATEPKRADVLWWRVIFGLVAVAVLGLVIPGGGLVVALVFFFTVFRHQPVAKWLAVGLGVVLLIGAVFAAGPRTSQDFRSTTTVVQQ